MTETLLFLCSVQNPSDTFRPSCKDYTWDGNLSSQLKRKRFAESVEKSGKKQANVTAVSEPVLMIDNAVPKKGGGWAGSYDVAYY